MAAAPGGVGVVFGRWTMVIVQAEEQMDRVQPARMSVHRGCFRSIGRNPPCLPVPVRPPVGVFPRVPTIYARAAHDAGRG